MEVLAAKGWEARVCEEMAEVGVGLGWVGVVKAGTVREKEDCGGLIHKWSQLLGCCGPAVSKK